MDCPLFSRQDPEDPYQCRPDACDGTILLPDGSCSTCEDFTGPDTSNRECIAEDCDQTTQILLISGSCGECERYFRPEVAESPNVPKNCIQDDCDPARNEVHDDAGACVGCPEYTHPDGDGTACVSDECGARAFLRTDGTCADCPDYTYPGPDGWACIADECGFTEYLLVAGVCAECPVNSHQDSENATLCSSDACQADEKLALNGTCEGCPPRRYASVEGTACVERLSPEFNETLGQLFEQGTLLERLRLFEEEAIDSEAYNYTVEKIFLFLNESYDFSRDPEQARRQLSEEWDSVLREGLTADQSLSLALYFEDLVQEEEFQAAFGEYAAYREWFEEALFELGLEEEFQEVLDGYESHKAKAWTMEELEAVWAHLWARPLV